MSSRSYLVNNDNNIFIYLQNPEATPYVSDHMLDVDAFNSTRAMTDATLFYYAVQDSLPLEDYDIAVTMTR